METNRTDGSLGHHTHHVTAARSSDTTWLAGAAKVGLAASRAVRWEMSSFVRDLRSVVEAESPTGDLQAVLACAGVIATLGRRLLGQDPTYVERAGRPHLMWTFPGPGPQITLVGHLDTVWPLGTLQRWPFAVDGRRATGPGVFDMKAGLVQMLWAVSSLPSKVGITLLVTSDEETGSKSSRSLLEEVARKSSAVLVCEGAGPSGSLKVERKGVALYEMSLQGRAAHAGLEPERGRNAAVAAASITLELAGWTSPAAGTTVTPTMVRSGTAVNVVPADACVSVDVRAATRVELEQVDHRVHRLTSKVDEVAISVRGGINRWPLELAASHDLFEHAVACCDRMGQPTPIGEAVGGASDANLTAAVGTPTLDGLGAVGGNAHAEGEWADMTAVADRVGLLCALIEGTRLRPPTIHPAPAPLHSR